MCSSGIQAKLMLQQQPPQEIGSSSREWLADQAHMQQANAAPSNGAPFPQLPPAAAAAAVEQPPEAAGNSLRDLLLVQEAVQQVQNDIGPLLPPAPAVELHPAIRDEAHEDEESSAEEEVHQEAFNQEEAGELADNHEVDFDEGSVESMDESDTDSDDEDDNVGEEEDGERMLLMEADTDILEATLFRQQQRLYGQEGIARMDMNEEELQWTRAVKTAIETSDELDNLSSDYLYAQYAIVERGNVPAALDRAARMQAFREEYGVLDTLADARRHLKGLVESMPGLFLSFSFNQGDSNYAVVLDVTKFDMSAIRTHEGVSSCIKGWYYLLQALAPDLEAVRRGATFLCECQGYQWRKDNMIDLKTFERAWQELGVVYPGRFNQIKFFHTGVCFNLLASMSKRFLPKEIHDYFEIGCNFTFRLDSIYLLPSLEDANDRICGRFDEALQRRFGNQQDFCLDTAQPVVRRNNQHRTRMNNTR